MSSGFKCHLQFSYIDVASKVLSDAITIDLQQFQLCLVFSSCITSPVFWKYSSLGLILKMNVSYFWIKFLQLDALPVTKHCQNTEGKVLTLLLSTKMKKRV